MRALGATQGDDGQVAIAPPQSVRAQAERPSAIEWDGLPPVSLRAPLKFRPTFIDGVTFPSMLNLEAAVRRAVLVGDVRRERVYLLARAVRLRRAQREGKR